MKTSRLILLLACQAAVARAEGGTSSAEQGQYDRSRRVLDQEYIDYSSSNDVVYESAPVTHVVPSFKTITLSLAGGYLDSTVNGPRANGNTEHELKMDGYRFAPYLAVSLKRIGLGFSAEAGKRTLDYKLGPGLGTQKQRSEVDYRAIGIYAYLLPFDSGGEQPVIASLVLGAKDYNVNHKATGLIDVNESFDARAAKYRYNVTDYEIGALIDWRLMKRFSIVPWVDYVYSDIHDPVRQADEQLEGTSSSGAKRDAAAFLKGDAKLLWQSHPRLDFGLDLVARLGSFALHLGDVFGLILNQNRPDTITDHSYVLHVSFDMQGE